MKNEYYILSENETIYRIPFKKIIRLEASGALTILHLIKDKPQIDSINIGGALKKLNGAITFFQTHKSHIVNMQHIKCYKKTEGGYALMSDNSHVPVAEARKPAFIKWYTA